MSREQRRSNRRQPARTGAAAPPSRRTPVKAHGASGPPWLPIAIVGGAAAIIALIAYLIYASSAEEGLEAHVKAEQDDSSSLPGVFHATQGRGHFGYTFTPDRTPRPFCEGVAHADDVDLEPTPSGGTTPGATSTPRPSATPPPSATPEASASAQTPGSETPVPSATPRTDCYNSNPPSSGQHLPVQRNADLGNGVSVNIPADPDTYEPDVHMPRESIPHILEHAGVFVGYHCAEGDTACLEVVDRLEGLVDDRIDNHDDRVVMSNFPDLPEGEIGLSGWTRVMNFRYQDYDEDEVERFISTHSCRFDPEGFC